MPINAGAPVQSSWPDTRTVREAEVLLAVCIAVVVGGHGRVATAHQIAPWSRGSDLLSPTAVGAAFRSTSVGGLSNFLSDMVIVQRRKSIGTLSG